MTTKRIGKDFTGATNATVAMNLHLAHGVPLTHAFRSVRGAHLDGGHVSPHLLRRNMGLAPR